MGHWIVGVAVFDRKREHGGGDAPTIPYRRLTKTILDADQDRDPRNGTWGSAIPRSHQCTAKTFLLRPDKGDWTLGISRIRSRGRGLRLWRGLSSLVPTHRGQRLVSFAFPVFGARGHWRYFLKTSSRTFHIFLAGAWRYHLRVHIY